MRRAKDRSIDIHIEDAEGHEETWTLFYNYTFGHPGTRDDPPEGGEVEFLHAELRDAKNVLVERKDFDDLVEDYDIDEKTIESWDEKASMAAEEEDDYLDPEDR